MTSRPRLRGETLALAVVLGCGSSGAGSGDGGGGVGSMEGGSAHETGTHHGDAGHGGESDAHVPPGHDSEAPLGKPDAVVDAPVDALAPPRPDAGVDAGPPPPCTAGAMQCSGNQPEVCDSSGTWQPNGWPCAVSQACTAGACVNAATSITTPPCNAPSYAQLPGNGNALFVGREQNAQLQAPAGCTGTSDWHLVLSSMDWTSSPPALSIVNHALFPTTTAMTIASGQSIFTAYDASVMSYGGEEWVAFECAYPGGGTVSACVGPLDETGAPSGWTIDASRTTIVVSGTSENSASVPKLVVFGGTPYLYYTTVTESGGTWTGAPTRGIALGESGNLLWPAGKTSAVDPLDASSVEVLSMDPLDPISSGYADASWVSTDGTYLYMMGGLGGNASNGCLLSTGGLNPNVAGCYRMFISRSTTPLTPQGFNEYRVPEYTLPDNASQYPRTMIDPSGDPWIIGAFYSAPTNVPADLPSLPQPAGGTFGQWMFPLDLSNQTYQLTYAQWAPGNWQMTSNSAEYFPTYWLGYQSDGNFVMYDYYNNPLWDIGQSMANDCPGSSCSFVFQSDGNLVAYKSGASYWESETNGAGAGLRFTSTPEFPYHAMIWNSAQSPIWQQ